MEEKIKDVYENIKDRLSNPLLFSFLCSWLVLNWKIPVALVWYDKTQFISNKNHNIFDFIENYWKEEGAIFWPIFIAIIYTLVIPFIKNGVRVLFVRANKWGDKNEAKYVFEGMTKEHLELKKSYETLSNSLSEKMIYIDNLYDDKIMSGNWAKKIKVEGGEIEKSVRFSGRDIYLIKKYNDQEKESEIEHFFYDFKNEKVFFVSVRLDVKKAFNERKIPNITYDITSLYIKGNGDMYGVENEYKVEYIKY